MVNTTKRVHNVRVRVHDKSESLVREVLTICKGNISDDQVEIKISEDEGLWIGELWIDHQQPVRAFLRVLMTELTEHEKHSVASSPTQFLDISTHCFLRLDKTMLHEAKYKLTTGSEVVSVRLNIAAFPATREKAAIVVTELFSADKV